MNLAERDRLDLLTDLKLWPNKRPSSIQFTQELKELIQYLDCKPVPTSEGASNYAGLLSLQNRVEAKTLTQHLITTLTLTQDNNTCHTFSYPSKSPANKDLWFDISFVLAFADDTLPYTVFAKPDALISTVIGTTLTVGHIVLAQCDTRFENSVFGFDYEQLLMMTSNPNYSVNSGGHFYPLPTPTSDGMEAVEQALNSLCSQLCRMGP